MKNIITIIATMFIAMFAFAGPASASGSNSPTPYTVNEAGVTLPAGQTFKANGHVNIKYTQNGGSTVKSKGIHFDPNNNQPGGRWIGESNIPWSGFGLSGSVCITWVQIDGFNEHFGEGGQSPVCLNVGEPDTTPSPSNKKVTLCHATGSESDPYVGITISVEGWLNGHKGHSGDIWEAFSYQNKDGDTIDVPKSGNIDLLQHPDCQPPKEDIKVTPSIQVVDKCGVTKDKVELIPGDGYTGSVTRDGLKYTVVAKTKVGFVFNSSAMTDWTLSNGGHTATKTVTLTDEDCNLPATGGEAKYNTTLGVAAIAGVVILGGVALATRKRS